MEDVIETLLGREILDESDCEADMRVQARQAWETRAKAQGLVEEPYSEPELENLTDENIQQPEAEK
jgi:CBS domain containing-hemolysin-like protein